MRSGALIALEVPLFSTIISPLKLSGQYKQQPLIHLFAVVGFLCVGEWMVREPDFFHAGPVD